ncbi:MAG: hypothetical protein HYV04_22380, partial [Deltaproteobacteria bacterium]|nr:hypothetical protein [Deltaproteobacteria bacterium]
RQFEAEEKEINFIRYNPKGFSADQEDEGRRWLSALTDLFTHPTVPDEVTSRAGNLLYRLFA